jgi:RHS repeat-associated protein
MIQGPKVWDPLARLHYTWDAWNRLVKVQADSGGAPGATLAEYQYDGQSRRIVKLLPNGANWDRTDFFENGQWQDLEERVLLNVAGKATAATAPKHQYVYDIRYIDAVAARDENKDGDASCVGAADQRLWYAHNTLFSVYALLDSTGAVVERFQYDPYGRATVQDPAGNPKADPNIGEFKNKFYFTGRVLDFETGLMYFRNRYYDFILGNFISRDPKNYVNGGNLFCPYFANNGLDPFGLESDADLKRSQPTTCPPNYPNKIGGPDIPKNFSSGWVFFRRKFSHWDWGNWWPVFVKEYRNYVFSYKLVHADQRDYPGNCNAITNFIRSDSNTVSHETGWVVNIYKEFLEYTNVQGEATTDTSGCEQAYGEKNKRYYGIPVDIIETIKVYYALYSEKPPFPLVDDGLQKWGTWIKLKGWIICEGDCVVVKQKNKGHEVKIDDTGAVSQ